MKKSGVTIFTFFFLVSLVIAPTPVASQNNTRPLSTAIQKNGWRLPELSEFKMRDSEQTAIDEVQVDLKHFAPVKRIDTVVQFFSLVDEKLRIVDLPVRILGVSQFAGKKGTFAYIVSYGLLNKRSDGSVALKGAMITAAFIDNDGDGLFETRHSDTDSLSSVPAWVTAD